MDKSNLELKIERNSRVVEELRSSQAWQIITEDLSEERKRLDNVWQLIHDDKELQEARVAKLALNQLLSLQEFYEADLKTAREHLADITSPETSGKQNYGDNP